jgi:hypothetical protein
MFVGYSYLGFSHRWLDHVRNVGSMGREISYMKYENGRVTGLVTSYAETSI